MALLDRIKFDAPSDDILVWKFPSEECRLGSQVIVNQSQEALLVKGGVALDLFGPGTHTLNTDNLPLLNKLVNLPFGGQTPFSAEVWFVSKTAKRGIRWGTSAPIPILDAVYNYPVSVRSFGQWGLRIQESRSFITQLVGTLQAIDTPTVYHYFSGEIVQRLSDALASFLLKRKCSVLEANAHLNELSAFVGDQTAKEFEQFGLEVINFNIERVSIPEEDLKKLQSVLGRRLEIDQISKANVGQAYVTMRTFDTLEAAAGNEGGGAGALLAGGLGLGVGLGSAVPLGAKLGQALNANSGAEKTGGAGDEHADRLRKLKALLDQGLITTEEFDAKKRSILDAI